MNLAADRRAIRSLRVGVVPSSHVLDLTVGAGPMRDILDRELELFKSGRQRPLVVSGEWGTGKSNLLSYLREYSLQRKIAVAYINLNGRSSAINHPQRFYHRVVADVRIPGFEGKGILGLLEAMKMPNVQDVIYKWASANTSRSELAQAFYLYVKGQRQWSLQIILGTDLAWADYAYKKEKAMRRLDDLGVCLRSLGYGGLMIQFDELETVMQLWNVMSRQGAYRVLHTLSNLKNVWSVYATTEKLNQQLALDRRYGKIRDLAALEFVEEYQKFPAIKPPVIDDRMGSELLRKVEGLYRRVYQVPHDTRLHHVMERWRRMPFRNPRRLIRYAIDHLDQQRPVPRA
jgi:hypothetical protein